MTKPNRVCAMLIAALALGRPETSLAQAAAAAPGGNDTAYGALRLMARTLGKETLDHVVEVTGRDGVPQPYLWKIVLQDGAAGTKEVEVSAGKIAAQRTLPKPSTRAAIHFSELNLDSSGAFDATDAQARKVHLRFDSVNYTLHTSEASGKPQWTLDLLNQEGGNVGAMRLSANDGNIVSIDGKLATGATPPAATPKPAVAVTSKPRETITTTRVTESHTTVSTAPVDPPPPPPPPPLATPETVVVEDAPTDHGDGGLFTRTGRTLDKTTHTVEHHLRRAGATVQRFFTGHSDLDPDAPPPPPPPDPNYRGD